MKHIIISIFLLAIFPLTGNAEAVEIDGIYYNLASKSKTAEVTNNPNYYSGTIVIPSVVTYGGIPYSVTSIGEKVFSGCWDLTSVTIPSSMTSIGDYAFYNCSGLTTVTIPETVTSIGVHAFSFTNLTSVVIPSSVKTIGDYAFSKCRGMNSIIIPNSVTSIGSYAFNNCAALTSLTIPNGVKSIEYATFEGCIALTSVTIPNSVTSIGWHAFDGCTGLTSVTIGGNVTSIGSSTFAHCRNLVDVYCQAESVPSTYSDAFKESYPEYMNLHVPGKSIDAYRAKEPWNKFKEILALDGTALAKVIIGSQGQGTFSFDQDLDFSDVSGIEVYVACGFNPANSQILLMKVQDAPAGTGLYVKTTSGKTGEFSIPVKSSYSYYMNMLKPVFASTTVPIVEDDYTNYVLTNGIFSKSNGSSKLEPNSAYLQFPTKLLSSSNQILSVSFVDDKLPGDVNGDGRVNVADIVALNNIIKSPTGSYSAAADLNNDGKVNDADISILVQMIMGR